MKNKLIHITWGTVLFHFIVCGLPFIAVLFGASLSFAEYFNKTTMSYLLILPAVMIIISLIVYAKDCNCGCDTKTRKGQKIGIIAACLLYGVALAGHFSGHFAEKKETGGVETCH